MYFQKRWFTVQKLLLKHGCFSPSHMLQSIANNTNSWIEAHRHKYSRDRYICLTKMARIKALLGILCLREVLCSSHQNLDDRKVCDNVGPIRDVFEHFKHLCQAHYSFGEYCSTDKMLTSLLGGRSIKVSPAVYQIKSGKIQDQSIRSYGCTDLLLKKWGYMQGSNHQVLLKWRTNHTKLYRDLYSPISRTGRDITMDN